MNNGETIEWVCLFGPFLNSESKFMNFNLNELAVEVTKNDESDENWVELNRSSGDFPFRVIINHMNDDLLSGS